MKPLEPLGVMQLVPGALRGERAELDVVWVPRGQWNGQTVDILPVRR